MLDKIKTWTKAPKFPDEPEKTWSAKLANAFILTTLVFSFILFIAQFPSKNVYVSLLVLVSFVFLSSILALIFIRKGRVYESSIGLLVVGFIIVTIALFKVGTVISAITSIYVFIIVISTLLFGNKGLLISLFFTAGILLLLIIAENYGIISSTENKPGYAHWATYVTLFGLVGMVTIYTANQLRDNESRYKAISELSSDYSFAHLINSDGSVEVEWTSGLLMNLVGYTESELENKGGWKEIVHPDDLFLFQNQNKALLKNIPAKVEYRIIHKDGHSVWLQQNEKPLWCSKLNRVYKIKGAIRNISESKKLLMDLHFAKEKAEESDRLKSSFLANMSHEIRTPLNGILGFSELLLDPEISKEEHQQFIGIVQKSGRNMLQTINDIIDISKVEVGLMDVNLEEHHVNETMDYLYDFFKLEAERKGLSFQVKAIEKSDKDLLVVDKFKLNKTLTNLIKNAIKYTDEGEIEFGCTANKSVFEFYVQDTGRGIPKEKIDSVFNRFIQAGNDEVHVSKGSGLGLSIAKAYIELHHGSIKVESELGKGSVFRFTIPIIQIAKI